MQILRAAKTQPHHAQCEASLLLPHAASGTSQPGSTLSGTALAMLSFNALRRSLGRWWQRRSERHYLMCADVEQQRVREAQQNVAYYHKRAALARAAQL